MPFALEQERAAVVADDTELALEVVHRCSPLTAASEVEQLEVGAAVAVPEVTAALLDDDSNEQEKIA